MFKKKFTIFSLVVLPPILVPRQAETGVSSVNLSTPGSNNNNHQIVTSTVATIQDLLLLDDLPLSIADGPDFIMSTAGVNSPSPASIGGSDGGGGTFPLTETPPPGYMSEDGDTQEPADLMSESFIFFHFQIQQIMCGYPFASRCQPSVTQPTHRRPTGYVLRTGFLVFDKLL